MVTEARMLQEPLLDDYTTTIKRIIASYCEVTMLESMQLATALLGGTEPPFGYLLPPWAFGACVKGVARFRTFAAGFKHCIGIVSRAKSFTEAYAQFHSCVTRGDGFIMYQLDMTIADYSRLSNQGYTGFLERGAVAGPGMVAMALELVGRTVDDEGLTPERDDGNAVPPPNKRRKTVRDKATQDDLRMSISICYVIASLLVDCPVWHKICCHYGVTHLSLAPEETTPAGLDNNTWKTLRKNLKAHTAGLLYHEVEYMLCELRRLVHKPKARQATSENRWISHCKNVLNDWRKRLLVKRRF